MRAHFKLTYELIDMPAPGAVASVNAETASTMSIDLAWDPAAGACQGAEGGARTATPEDALYFGTRYGQFFEARRREGADTGHAAE